MSFYYNAFPSSSNFAVFGALAALQIRNLNNQEQSTAREIRWEWLAFAFIG
jgi:hypothetical protein